MEGDKQLPAVMIGWDEKTQNVSVRFDTDHFKTWDFVLAILEMAKLKAEVSRRVMIEQQMAQNAMRQMQGRDLRSRLKLGS